MGVVFAVLTLLAASIKVFDRIDSLIPAEGTVEKVAAIPSPAGPSAALAEPVPASESDDARAAAAIAVALALAEAEQSPATASRLASGSEIGSTAGSWTTSGRAREMSNRMPGLGTRPGGKR